MDIFKPLKDVMKDVVGDIQKLHPSGTKTIIVAKAICTPARHPITAICKQYGIKILGYKEETTTITLEGWGEVPHLQLAKVTVSDKQAVWCEYLLLRSKKFFLHSQPLNDRNREWAEKHNVMPESWNGKPLIEIACEARHLLEKPPKKK